MELFQVRNSTKKQKEHLQVTLLSSKLIKRPQNTEFFRPCLRWYSEVFYSKLLGWTHCIFMWYPLRYSAWRSYLIICFKRARVPDHHVLFLGLSFYLRHKTNLKPVALMEIVLKSISIFWCYQWITGVYSNFMIACF